MLGDDTILTRVVQSKWLDENAVERWFVIKMQDFIVLKIGGVLYEVEWRRTRVHLRSSWRKDKSKCVASEKMNDTIEPMTRKVDEKMARVNFPKS